VALWDPDHRSRRRRRIALRRQLVHAAGCVELDHGIRCMVYERFNYDTEWPALARELGVRIPRSLRELYRPAGTGR
jgi:hypothetical protein